MAMHIAMHYGKTGLRLEFPDAWDITVIRKRPLPILRDPGMALKAALERPAGGSPLDQLAKRHHNACILICDVTRPVPNGVILPAIIKQLISNDMKQTDISVLLATGLHRPNEGPELLEVVGSEWVMQTVKVENHFARRDEDHVNLGTTKIGTPVKLDRRFVEAGSHSCGTR